MALAAKSAEANGLHRRAVWTISASHLFNDLMTSGIVPSLLPLFKVAFHLTYGGVGLIVLISYLTSSVMQPLFGMWSDRKPRPWLLPAGVTVAAVGLSLSGAVPTFPLVLAAVAFSGLGSGAFHPEASRGAHLAAGHGAGKGVAQAIFQVGGNLGQALGPLMLPLFVIRYGLHSLLVFLLPAVLVFAMAWRLVPWYKQRAAEERGRKRQARGRNRPGALALLVGFVILRSFTQMGLAGFLPFLFLEHHVSLGQAEIYTFLYLFAGACATFAGGALSDRLGMWKLVVISTALAVPFAWLLPRTSGGWTIPILLALGLTILSSFAVTVVYGQRLLPRKVGLVSGLLIGLAVGAGGIGASVLGALADRFGLLTLFDLIFLLPAAATILAAFLPTDRRLAQDAA